MAVSPVSAKPIPTPNSGPDGIVTGPDGNLWFSEAEAGNIGRLTPTGTFVEFAIPTAGSTPQGIARGPDGNLWFAENGGAKIGRITPSGVITEFPTPTASSQPTGIAAGRGRRLRLDA